MTAERVFETVGIGCRFGSFVALESIDFHAHAGEVTVILGPSGSGKSTLLRCLNHLEIPESGEVRFLGQPLPRSGRALCRARSRIGMVFQQFNLFPHLNALGNVALGPRRVLGLPETEAKERAEAALEQVGLADRMFHRPAELSGGQQQRVAIARALAMRPKAILLDEPTSSLDPERVGEVLDVLRLLAAAGQTMVVVTHELRFAREIADRAWFLEAGRVVLSGDGRDLLTDPDSPRLRRFLGLDPRDAV